MKRALTMEFFVKAIVGRKIESQDSYSDDDISAISDSDSDILVTVERPILSNFWTMIAQRWQGLKKR